MSNRIFAIVNPAAGHGGCGRLAAAALERVRAQGIDLGVAETAGPGHAAELARSAYVRGTRRFLVVGGDGSACEVVNGLVPVAEQGGAPQLAFLPLGTGNSFLRDFTDHGGVDQTIAALARQAPRPCDVLRLTHSGECIYAINQIGMGFIADVAEVANRSLKGLGELGYIIAALARTVALRHSPCPIRIDDEADVDRRPALFVAFANSRCTGGRLLLAPGADTADGLVDVIRCGPIGRLQILRRVPMLYDGSHSALPFVSSSRARRVEFELDAAQRVSIDGDVMTIRPDRLDVLPSAIQVLV